MASFGPDLDLPGVAANLAVSSCPISAMLALMIFPIRSIPICEVSCEHDSITEVAGDGEILIMLSARLCGFYAA
jgi:hypothetical protein